MSLFISAPAHNQQRLKFLKPEERGIDLIPMAEQNMKEINLFWLWAGAIFNVEYLVYGALILSFGLSFYQAVGIILIGNLSYFAVGFMSLQGPQTGTTAMMIGRGVFGKNGNKIVAFFNWITQEGYTVLGLVLIVLLVSSMLSKGGIHSGNTLKIGILLLALCVQFILPYLGHDAIKKVLRYLAYLFIPMFIVMAFLVVPNINLATLHNQHASWQLLTAALVVIISVGGFGWTENANDYSRYIPPTASKSKIILAATLGGLIPSILLELLGAAAYTINPQVTAVTGIPSSFASWFFWPFAILALPQIFSIGTLDIYSAGVTLQALGIEKSRRTATVIINMVFAGIVTLLVILKGNLYTDLSGFLDYSLLWLAPWFGIYIVDYWLRHGQYSPAAFISNDGIYWRNGGYNIKALASLGIGMLAGVLWINGQSYVPSFMGPLSKATGGADLSWLLAIVSGSVVYYFLSFKSVRQETAAPAVVAVQESQEMQKGGSPLSPQFPL